MSTLRPIDVFFQQQQEPAKSVFQFLRQYIKGFDPAITETWRYGMPFYNYGDKRFCYLWYHKTFRQPYIGFVDGNRLDHPHLLQEKRMRMKILLIDPARDLPEKEISDLMLRSIALCDSK